VANVDMQALDKSIRFLAKVKITQTANRITFSAKEEIVINGGGSFTRLNGQGIQDATSGAWTSHAVSHKTPQGKSQPVVMPAMPRVSQTRFHQQFRAVDPGTGQAVAGLSYQVVLEDGKKFAGKTDADGKTAVIATTEPNAIQLFWGGPQTEPVANEDIKDQGC
jgi:type VI secretion system secreted protein VgrG